jgi:hypothetical protein
MLLPMQSAYVLSITLLLTPRLQQLAQQDKHF